VIRRSFRAQLDRAAALLGLVGFIAAVPAAEGAARRHSVPYQLLEHVSQSVTANCWGRESGDGAESHPAGARRARWRVRGSKTRFRF
jgi:hypothetical protein